MLFITACMHCTCIQCYKTIPLIVKAFTGMLKGVALSVNFEPGMQNLVGNADGT